MGARKGRFNEHTGELVHFPGQTAAQLHAELAMLAPRALWTRAKECGVSLSEATDDYHSLVAIRAQTVEAELKARADGPDLASG